MAFQLFHTRVSGTVIQKSNISFREILESDLRELRRRNPKNSTDLYVI